jgi:hypothetical protein
MRIIDKVKRCLFSEQQPLNEELMILISDQLLATMKTEVKKDEDLIRYSLYIDDKLVKSLFFSVNHLGKAKELIKQITYI